jgi:hypothetical protein
MEAVGSGNATKEFRSGGNCLLRRELYIVLPGTSRFGLEARETPLELPLRAAVILHGGVIYNRSQYRRWGLGHALEIRDLSLRR